MCLDRLDRDEQRGRDLAVAEAARDQPHHLLLARREPVELVVGHRDVPGAGPEGIEHEPGESRREDRVAAGHLLDRVAELGAGARGYVTKAITSAPPPPQPPGRCT